MLSSLTALLEALPDMRQTFFFSIVAIPHKFLDIKYLSQYLHFSLIPTPSQNTG